MTDRFIAFDVETPNANNNRMSAIGIAVVEDGMVVESFDTLINPECRFDSFNIILTGITPEAVRTAPTFPELWEEIGPLMDSGILAAHNAPFDMSVLAKCLNWYGIPWKGYAQYVCTCRMGRRCYPELPDHKLNTLCDYLGIELDHHRADSDSLACAGLLLNYLDQGMEIEPWLRTYDLLHCRTLQTKTRNRRWNR